MNEVANRGAASTAVAALGNLRAGLQNVQSTIVVAGGVPILRMLKDGEWVYGPENIEIEDGSMWAVNPFSFQHGWVAWTDRKGGKSNEIVGESMVDMQRPIPDYNTLPDVEEHDNASWKQQLSVELQCLNGTDVGETVVYKTTSVGGMNAIKTLIAQLMKQLETSPDRPVPVLQPTFDTYNHKTHGKVYVPILEVTKWVELSDTPPEVDEPEPQPEPEKPARSRRAAPAETKPEPAKPAPEKDDQQTVAVSAADRKAALLAEIKRLEQEAAGDDGDEAGEPEPEQEAAPQPRRRRPARA